MGTRPSWIGFVVLGVGSVFLTILPGSRAAWSVYLPTVGPSPLRFQAPARVSSGFSLALVRMPDSAPAGPPLTSPAPANSPAPSSDNSPVVTDSNAPISGFSGWPPDETNAEAGGVGSGPPVQISPTVPASLPIPLTPQMLLPYFQPVNLGTNGGTGTAVIPLVFTPPVPVVPPPSRATYQLR